MPPSVTKSIPWILLCGALAVTLYGLRSEHLFSQPVPVWQDEGVTRFLWYAAIYWAAANVILWKRPGFLLPVAAAFVLLYTAWWTGPPALLAALYFLGSCYCLGCVFLSRFGSGPRPQGVILSILLGAAAWMFLLWMALHFPINTPWTYGIAFALPYVAYVWQQQGSSGDKWVLVVNKYDFEEPALAVLLFVLLAH